MTAPAQPETGLLEMKNIIKEYRGVAALKGIDFDLRRGEVHAILGENGAGKSTLVKILSGAVAPSAGEILLEGQTIVAGAVGDGGVAERRVSGLSQLTPDRADARGC
jgi:ABC-type sugar transport system ATPase subunit